MKAHDMAPVAWDAIVASALKLVSARHTQKNAEVGEREAVEPTQHVALDAKSQPV